MKKTSIIILIIGLFTIFNSIETNAQSNYESIEHFELGSMWVRLDSAINADIKELPCPAEYKKLKKFMRKSKRYLRKAYFADIKYRKSYNFEKKIPYYEHMSGAIWEYTLAKINYDYLCKKAGKEEFHEKTEDHSIITAYTHSEKFFIPENLK